MKRVSIWTVNINNPVDQDETATETPEHPQQWRYPAKINSSFFGSADCRPWISQVLMLTYVVISAGISSMVYGSLVLSSCSSGFS